MATKNLDGELLKLKIDKTKKAQPRRGGGGVFMPLLAFVGFVAAGALTADKLGYVKLPLAAAGGIEVTTAPVVMETSAQVSRGSEILVGSGYVIPRDKIEISSKIVGVVKDILVDRGYKVKKGDVILYIDDEEFQAQVKVAEARVATLKARVAELRTGSRPQEIQAARAAVALAEANVRKAKSDFDRLAPLATAKVISQQELDVARQAHDVAAANLNSARENSEMMEIGPRREVIQAAEAQLREAEANLEYAQTQLSYTVIKCPTDGIILEKLAKKGELVTNTNFGGTRGAKSSVVSLADLSDLQIELDVNESDIPKVKVGQKCEILLDSHPDRVFKGVVDEVAPQADRQKATVQVKVKMLDPDDTVRPEVSARVKFLSEAPPVEAAEAEAPKTRIWAPAEALVEAGGQTRVFIEAEGTAVARIVKTGEKGPKGVQVTDGLAGTETLIVAPLDQIQDGAKIKLKQQ